MYKSILKLLVILAIISLAITSFAQKPRLRSMTSGVCSVLHEDYAMIGGAQNIGIVSRACQAKSLLPEEFQDQFDVLQYDLYPIMAYTDASKTVEQFYQKALTEVQRIPYFHSDSLHMNNQIFYRA
jgi:hypothetical protein